MSGAASHGRQARIAVIESLEARSLLSNVDLSFTVDHDSAGAAEVASAGAPTAFISLAPARLDGGASHQAAAPMPGLHASVPVDAPRLIESGLPHGITPTNHRLLFSASAQGGGELVIEVNAASSRVLMSTGVAYMDGDWMVIEVPMPSADVVPDVTVYGPGGSVSQPGSSSLQPPQPPIPRPVSGSQPGTSDVVGSGSDDGAPAHDSGGTVTPDRKGDTSPERSPIVAAVPRVNGSLEAAAAAPVASVAGDRRSVVDESDSASEGSGTPANVAAGQQVALKPLESSVPDPLTQPSGATGERADSALVLAESVRGIKIRGSYVDPGDAQSKKTVELAVIRFETPMTVRLQPPFVLDVKHDMSPPVSNGSEPADAVVGVDAVDAVLADVDELDGGLQLADWQVSGVVALAAAALGYFIGSHRAPSLEAQAGAAGELFTPVFSEAQLSRLTRRLGTVRAERPTARPVFRRLPPANISMEHQAAS